MATFKLLLCLLAIGAVVGVVWTGYLLFTHRIAPITGTIVFLMEVGFLIWIIWLLRSRTYRWRKPSFKIVLGSLIFITLVSAFAGVEPLSSAKDAAISFISEKWQTAARSSQSGQNMPSTTSAAPSSQITPSYETYWLPTTAYPFFRQQQLKTVATRSGQDEYLWKVTVGSSPWVLNCEWQRVSTIGATFNVIVAVESEYNQRGGYTLADLLLGDWIWTTTSTGPVEACVIPKKGTFLVKIEAAGVKWRLRVGVD